MPKINVISSSFFLAGDDAKQIHRKLVSVLGAVTLAECTVREWCQRFRSGNFDVEEHRGGDHRSGPQTDVRIAVIRQAFEQSRGWSLRSLSAQFGISRSTCHQIVTEELKMTQNNAEWVPHELSPGQMETRVVYCTSNLKTILTKNSVNAYRYD